MRRQAGLLILMMALVAPGCVTETITRRPAAGVGGVPLRQSSTTGKNSSKPAEPVKPLATPAASAQSIRSEVRVAVRPIGSIPFDGQVLPLVSPDGHYLATQIGEAPTWGTLLAQNGAKLPIDTSVVVYDLSVSPPREAAWGRALPSGFLLGRSATTHEFIVEEPQADGSRWIGAVSWETWQLRWLVQGDDVNAHAVCLTRQGPADAIVFTRRAPTDGVGRLVILAHGEETELTPPEGEAGIMAAVPSDDAPVIFTFELRSNELDLVAHPMLSTGAVAQAASRVSIATKPSDPTLIAYQALTPVHPWTAPLSRRSGIESENTPPGLLFHHPGMGRMVVMDPRDGSLAPLAAKSVAGAWSLDPLGWSVFVSTPEGLMHQRLMREEDTGRLRAQPAARALNDPYVPYATHSAERPYVLIGPTRDPRRLSVVLMDVVREEPAPAQ